MKQLLRYLPLILLMRLAFIGGMLLGLLLLAGCTVQMDASSLDGQGFVEALAVRDAIIKAEWAKSGERFVEYRTQVDLVASRCPGRRAVREEVIVRIQYKDGRIRHYLQSATTWATATPLCESFPQAAYRDADGNYQEIAVVITYSPTGEGPKP